MFGRFDAGGVKPSEKVEGAKDMFDSYKAIYDLKDDDETKLKVRQLSKKWNLL